MNKEHLLTFLVVGIIPIAFMLSGYPMSGLIAMFVGSLYLIIRSNYKHW
jgi:hypothetical protein